MRIYSLNIKFINIQILILTYYAAVKTQPTPHPYTYNLVFFFLNTPLFVINPTQHTTQLMAPTLHLWYYIHLIL